MLDKSIVKDYETFVGMLRLMLEQGATTKQVLLVLYWYYKDYVRYNYDQLQIVKLQDDDLECAKIYDEIRTKISSFNRDIKEKGIVLTSEVIEEAIKTGKIYSKEEAIKKLNEAFMKVEGRPLTESNKLLLFSNYDRIQFVPHQPAKSHFQAETPAFYRMQGITPINYEPKYENGMITEGTCLDYTNFEGKIFNDLGIKYKRIGGIGTTKHAWNMVYLPEEDEKKWVHIDMTMVRFYLDNWIKNHNGYKAIDWICATTDKIFEMQNSRKIKKVGKHDCKPEITKDNQEELVEMIEMDEGR